MSITLEDSKRTAIACTLADLKEVQNLIISNLPKLISACDDQNVRDRMQEMLQDDQKNMGIIDTVMVQYGVSGEPKETIKMMVEKLQKMMDSSDFSLYEKVFQLELLKHQQVMTGLLVHKAAQVVGADVEAAITPLNTVNFENRAHQEQLKGVMEILGVRELTGEEAQQGLWARVQDAVAALTGVTGSTLTQNSDKSDMNIQDVIRMDHNKVNVLFMEIAGTEDAEKINEYFGQIYKDLSVHAEAEEQVVYPTVRSFYGEDNTQELYDEQSEMKRLLEELKASNASVENFKPMVEHLREAVMDHVRQEESTMFAAIRNNCSTEQQEQLATDFKSVKSQIQDQMVAIKG